MHASEVNDRIAAHLREGGSCDAESIARDFLCLTSPGGPTVRALVRAMLAADERFHEAAEGTWRLAAPPAKLSLPVVLCVLQVPSAARREPWLWRITAELWGAREPRVSHTAGSTRAGLGKLRQWLRRYPAATARPGSLRRWLGAHERLHAWPELDPIVIDLRAWSQLLSPAPAAHEPEDVEAELAQAARTTEQIVAAAAARGLRSWWAVAAVPDGARQEARERVWARDWAVREQEIATLPEEPGIYRFFDRDGALLYVGKAKNLRRRVAAYFRPLDDRARRRGQLLDRLHRLAVEPLPTELDALLREAAIIRESRPPWNVQIDFGREPREFPLADRDLVLLLPATGGGASLFALAGPRAAAATLIEAPRTSDLATALRDFFVAEALLPPLQEVAPPERQLVRRWLRWETAEAGDAAQAGGMLLRLSDFTTYQAVADAICHALSASSSGAGVAAPTTLLRETD